MKKIVLLIIIILVVLVIAGITAVYAKDSPMFDIFFSEKVREVRDLNRLASLYPEEIGDFRLYSRGIEKVRKETECGEINETINKASGNIEIKGKVCNRYTIGQYRTAGSNRVIFVHIIKTVQGAETQKNIILNTLPLDNLGGYSVTRPERHEIGWLVDSSFSYILTQEGTVKSDPDGGESMNYMTKATGDNPVTQYFLAKFPPAKLSAEELNMTCADSDGNNSKILGFTEGNYYDPIKKETRKEKVKDICVGDSSFKLQDADLYIKAGFITKEQSTNKNILMEAYCSEGFIKIAIYECPNGCRNGACFN